MRQPSLAAALLAGAALFSAALPAHATYCRAKACDDKAAYDDIWQDEPDPPCVRNDNGCLVEGKPLFWPQTCLSFGVQKDGSQSDGIDYATAHDIIAEGFATWLNAACEGGGTPSFTISDYGPIDCRKAEYNEAQPNANVFMFRDTSWPYKDAFATLALTTITYNRENGEIYDADVEINSFQHDFTVGDDDVRDDLSAILTHEIGHFLGLSHDEEEATTMYCCYKPTETQQRTLHADDIAGICEIYPPDRRVDAAHCDPRHGFSSNCATAEDTGCGIGGPSRGHATTFGAIALFGIGLGLRRLRRRETRSPR